jgi:hypothetical protein
MLLQARKVIFTIFFISVVILIPQRRRGIYDIPPKPYVR